MSDIKTCTSCSCLLPPEVFIYKNKANKTCSACLTTRANKRAEKRASSVNNELENIQTEYQFENEIETIAFTDIIEFVFNKIANLEQDTRLFFSFHVKLDDNILVKVHQNMKLLVKLIVDEIKEGRDIIGHEFTTGPNISVRYPDIEAFYLSCSQCHKLEREYKESNHKRMAWFNCHGKLVVNIDMATKELKIKLSHDIYYKKLVDIITPEEIKNEIMQNLHMDPVQLRTHLQQKFDTSQVTLKQINYWWSVFNQCFFKLDEDSVTSARRFLENSHIGLRTKALIGFLSSFCNKGLYSQYFFTNKDFTKINATKEPDLNRSDSNYYIVCPPELRDKVTSFIEKHFNMHPKIPVNVDGQFLIANKICIFAVNEVYNFCFENNLVLLWAYLWSSWYKATRWTLWARSMLATIPLKYISKEVNIQESIILQETQSFSVLQTCDIVKMDQDEEAFNHVTAVKRMANHLEQELLANNLNHIIRVVNNMDKLFTILNDIETSQNRRKRDPTWHESTPWTLFLQ
ncbi:4578_t:CDS:2 [Gigaspora margarita]|uniref:4578_t:CDS:1 n=1 Tax=Gigaspora margarita TaxID=4874 RepID=A0ABN7UDI6_GIGMA|nr:4578_t:CDS:2 [Gigaspora margarita]